MKISEKHNTPPPYSHKGFELFVRKNNPAFTLAEVLITLTIIGVIAALTVPSLMTKVQDHGFRSAFLKNYAVIQNAYAQSIKDGVPFWGYGPGIKNGDYFIYNIYRDNLDLIKDYFKIAKGPYSRGEDHNQHFKYFYPNRTHNELSVSTFKYLNGEYAKNYVVGTQTGGLTFQLTDGTIISFCTRPSYVRTVFIDVNGEKGPNTFGRDIYWLQAAYDKNTDIYKLLPYGDIHTGHFTFAAYGTTNAMANTCKMNSTGDTCAFEIIKNRAYKIPKE